MVKPRFIRFSKRAVLPRERKQCLVIVGWRKWNGVAIPPTLAVGYLRYQSCYPYWVVPGVGGPVTHYADCLGDDFVSRSDWAGLSERVQPRI